MKLRRPRVHYGMSKATKNLFRSQCVCYLLRCCTMVEHRLLNRCVVLIIAFNVKQLWTVGLLLDQTFWLERLRNHVLCDFQEHDASRRISFHRYVWN